MGKSGRDLINSLPQVVPPPPLFAVQPPQCSQQNHMYLYPQPDPMLSNISEILSLYIYIYICICIWPQIINPYKFPPLTHPSTNCQKKICKKNTSHHPSFNPHPPPSSASSLHECRRLCQALPPLPWWSLSRTSKPAKLIMEQIWWPIVRHRYLSLFDGDP